MWAIIDGSDCRLCALARIDPKTLKVTNRYPVPGGATAVRAGLGGVWITNYQTDAVVRLDPSTGKVVATIPVASGPRFFDVGAGAVWVMAQSAGALCRVDPAGNRLVGCAVIDPDGVEGGDLTVGTGSSGSEARTPWSPRSIPEADGSSGASAPARAAAAPPPAPGSSGSRHMTPPSCTGCPWANDMICRRTTAQEWAAATASPGWLHALVDRPRSSTVRPSRSIWSPSPAPNASMILPHCGGAG